jgi:PKD repeat protein
MKQQGSSFAVAPQLLTTRVKAFKQIPRTLPFELGAMQKGTVMASRLMRAHVTRSSLLLFFSLVPSQATASDLRIDSSSILFSSLDGGASDADGVADGILTLGNLTLTGRSAILIDVPVASFRINGNLLMDGTSAIRPAGDVTPLVGPTINIFSDGPVLLTGTARIAVDGTTTGGSISFCTLNDIVLTGTSALSATGFGPNGAGGRISLQGEGRIKLDSAAARILADGVSGGSISLASCALDTQAGRAGKTGMGSSSAVLIQGLVQATGRGGRGGSVGVIASHGSISFQNQSQRQLARVNAFGSLGNGTIILTAAGVVFPNPPPTSPPAVVVSGQPVAQTCDCGISVTIAVPADQTLTNATTIDVSGTVRAFFPIVTLTANGVPATVTGNTYLATNTPLPQEGLNTISVVAEDAIRNMATASVSVIRDTIAPDLQFLSPTDGAALVTTTPTITVAFSDTGSGVDLSSYQTSLDGLDYTPTAIVTPTGATYTIAAPLSQGEHTATARIADLAGNVTEVTIHFTISVFRAIADCAPTSGTAPLTVRFRSRGEFPGGSIIRYRWDFQGDGVYDTSDPVARDFNFTFQRSGTFPARLEVTNNFNEIATDTCRIEVEGNAPTATANAIPSNGPVPLTVTLTCTGNDPDGTIALYEWDFDGDGIFDFSSPSSGTTSHTYDVVGTFTAICRVTDNDGLAGQARATTTVIRSGPPGSPSVEATASPGTGNAPLTVSFNGTATDDGTIVLWEWDFDGDGTFDFSSPTSPATSFQYVNAGIFAAALRATDNTGLTGTDTVQVTVNLVATLSIPDDTFDPTIGETAAVNTSITGGVPVRVYLKDQLGAVVRTLVDTTRAAGNYSDPWDGRNDLGDLLPQAPYYAILEYNFAGEIRRVDLTNTTGSVRYNPSRNSLPSTFRPFEDNLLTINFTIPANRGASEIQAFIGLFNVDVRFLTLLERVPLGVGTHTIQWDGVDASGHIAVPPPGDAFLFGIFGFTLPDNAIFIQAAPVLSSVTVDPNFFDPGTPNFLTPDAPTATVMYTLNKLANVDLTVTNLTTGIALRRIQRLNVAPGAGLTIEWDGRADNGLFVDKGDYRLSLQATDSTGSRSLVRGVLVRVFY